MLGVDVLAPEGYGEIIGGGQRIHDPELLLKRIEEHICREKRSSGTSICASTELCPTAVSAWESSAAWRGFAVWNTFGKRSHSQECCIGCGHRAPDATDRGTEVRTDGALLP